MAKAKFQRTKPHVNIGTIGTLTWQDHLTAAITGPATNSRSERDEGIRGSTTPRGASARGITINIAHVGTRPTAALRTHVDAPNHADYIRT